MTDAATAFVTKGARGNWPPTNNPPSYSIGFTLGEGSWPHQPGWDKRRATESIVIWPNPAFGSVFDNPGRFGTIAEWRPKKATGWFLFDFLRQWKQAELDIITTLAVEIDVAEPGGFRLGKLGFGTRGGFS